MKKVMCLALMLIFILTLGLQSVVLAEELLENTDDIESTESQESEMLELESFGDSNDIDSKNEPLDESENIDLEISSDNNQIDTFEMQNPIPYQVDTLASTMNNDSMNVQTNDHGSSMGFEYVHNGDGTITIFEYTGGEEEVTVPSTLDGYPVKRISGYQTTNSSGTYYGGAAISDARRVIISEGIESLGAAVFANNRNLERIVLPGSIDFIEDFAFFRCSSLGSITIPNKVETIGYEAFGQCSKLESVEIPEAVTSIGAYIFSGCSKLSIALFQGDTPVIGQLGVSVMPEGYNSRFDDTYKSIFEECSENFIIYYNDKKSGWTTPEWNGYECYPYSGEYPDTNTNFTLGRDNNNYIHSNL